MKQNAKVYLFGIGAVMLVATAVFISEGIAAAAIAIWPALGFGYLTKMLVDKLK